MSPPKAPVACCGSIRISLYLLLLLQGCTTIGSRDLHDEIQSLSPAARNRVYAHFVNSPLDLPQIGRLASVATFFREAGLSNTRYHLTSSGEALAAQIRQTRSADPSARIALIGWSGASLWIWDALVDLSESGQGVELVIYLDSNWIKERTARQGHPANVSRTLLIYRVDNPPVSGILNSSVRRIPTPHHLALAAHPDTVQSIAEALIDLILD